MKNLNLFQKIGYKHLIILLLVLTGCVKNNDDDFDPDQENGSFEISITGDESRTLSGDANFLHVSISQGNPDEVGSSLAITFIRDDDEEDAFTISLVSDKGGGIAEGTYNFTEDPAEDETYLSFSFYSEVTSSTYISVSGTVKLTKITSTSIEGTVSGELTSFDGKTVNVSGEFEAVGISQFF